MTTSRNVKRRVRARMAATGERYTTALAAVLAQLDAAPPAPAATGAHAIAPATFDAEDRDG